MSIIKSINSLVFKPYGWVIEPGPKPAGTKKKNLFRIVLKEEKKLGWRIAYLVVRDKTIDKLEQHPESFESFEPVKGRSLLYVAGGVKPKEIKCFYLDKPVVLKKGIWHGVITLGKESEIKITENAEVRCVYQRLKYKL